MVFLLAMVSKVDQSVGEVVSALGKKGMLENSIIIFIADNGAPSIGVYQNWGSNYPLRGVSVTFLILVTKYFTGFGLCG